METENELLLKQKIHSLEQEIEQLKEHLKKYTAPSRSKLFYENHKSTVLQKNKEYKDKTNYYSILTAEKKKDIDCLTLFSNCWKLVIFRCFFIYPLIWLKYDSIVVFVCGE